MGDALDRETQFRWLWESVIAPALEDKRQINRWIVNAVRKPEQVTHIRQMAGLSAVRHVHLAAPEDTLQARYDARQASAPQGVDQVSYEAAIRHPNEVSSRTLGKLADAVIDSSTLRPGAIAIKILGLFAAS